MGFSVQGQDVLMHVLNRKDIWY